MNDFQKNYLLKRQDYGLLYPYVKEEAVTDINWNGKQLWIDDLEKGRYMAAEVLTAEFAERFATLLANLTNQSFNKMNPVMEAETEELRISIVHQSVAHAGITISIRKIPAVRRLEKSDMVANGYCSEAVLDLLVHCIMVHCSVVICGLPGSGKTELLKYLTQYIPAEERVITIEDVLEIHYQKMNPNKDCVEMKVAENFTYTEAIRASLRQFPKWILLSEARSAEVRYFLESLSTGVSGITTLHADDIRNIPDCIKNMAGGREDRDRIENDTYRYLDVGILLKSKRDSSGEMSRYIDQIGVFERYNRNRTETVNRVVMVVEDGKIVNRKLPRRLIGRWKDQGIDPGTEWREA